MESDTFKAKVREQNRITIDKNTVEILGIKQDDMLKVTVEKLKP